MFKYSVARELLKGNEYLQGLSDSDIDYLLIMKMKNSIRERRIQKSKRKAMVRANRNQGLKRWSK